MPLTSENSTSSSKNQKAPLPPIFRMLLSVAIAGAVFFILKAKQHWLVCANLAWLSFALTYLFLAWIIILRSDTAMVSRFAKKEDGSLAYVFVLIVLSSIASLVFVVMLKIDEKEAGISDGQFVAMAVGTIICSWSLIHTLYTFHYARMYYKHHHGGLNFPEDEEGTVQEHDYLDFVYFSFNLGCAFQTSDVQITDRKMRRVVFVHSLLAFFVNSFIVALTINILAGLTP